MSKIPKPQSLELYLAQIAHELRALPATARADELREIKAHLGALVLASQQLEEVSEAEATATALKQFGAPRRVGRALRRAWQRKQPEAWGRAVLAPMTALTFFVLTTLSFNEFALASPNQPQPWLHPSHVYAWVLCSLLQIFCTGFVAGVISPKRGIALTYVCSFWFVITIPMVIKQVGVTNLTDASSLTMWIGLAPLCWAGTRVGAYFGRKFLARIAGDSKLNVQL